MLHNKRRFGSILERLGGVLGRLGGLLGRLGGVLGASWGVLGASWNLLGASWWRLGASWAVWEPSWGVLGASWVHLGASWTRLGPLWVAKTTPRRIRQPSNAAQSVPFPLPNPPPFSKQKNSVSHTQRPSHKELLIPSFLAQWFPCPLRFLFFDLFIFVAAFLRCAFEYARVALVTGSITINR